MLWLYMSLETFAVNIRYNYFLVYPWMKPGNIFFKAGQNRVCMTVNNPQYSSEGLHKVRGRSSTSLTQKSSPKFCCWHVYTSPPFKFKLKLPGVSSLLAASLIICLTYLSFLAYGKLSLELTCAIGSKSCMYEKSTSFNLSNALGTYTSEQNSLNLRTVLGST